MNKEFIPTTLFPFVPLSKNLKVCSCLPLVYFRKKKSSYFNRNSDNFHTLYPDAKINKF